MTKEELQNYRSLERERRHVKAKLEETETALYSPRAQQLTGMPSAPPKPGSTLEAAVARHTEDLEALRVYYQELLNRLAAEQLAIEKAIDSLDTTARDLMRHRYIDGRKWEEICVLMSYSWRQVHRIHADALTNLRREESK
jgi:DNA-directed RNA polymerase specialized sigma24 family protein